MNPPLKTTPRTKAEIAAVVARVRAMLLAGTQPKEICSDLGLSRSYYEKLVRRIGFARVQLLPEERAWLKAIRQNTNPNSESP